MTSYIRDPFTGKTFTLKDWEVEKQRRKEQMAREYHESHAVDTSTSESKILFVYMHPQSFVHNDIQLLSKHFDVTPFFFSGVSCIQKLYKAIRKTDLIFVWFASYHAFLTALLNRRKPMIVVTGGYDVAGEKSINYGLMNNFVYRQMVRYVLKRTAKVIAVSEFNKQESKKYLGVNAELIYNCVDSKQFKPDGEKENIILTVGHVKKETWTRKGFKSFVEAAEEFHRQNRKEHFYVVGKIEPEIQQEITNYKNLPNLTFTGFVSDEDLLNFYQKAKVYCQLSRYESFGVSLAEAMSCECIPVVTDRAALPEVAGDYSFVSLQGCLQDVCIKIENALEAPGEIGTKARERVVELFSPGIRESKLIDVVNEVFAKRL